MKTFDLLKKAKNEHFAIGAFNVANLEALKAVIQAAVNLNSPIIIEASEGEINFIGKRQLVSLIKIYKEETGLPIILNLDHGKSFESCKEAVDAGFDYVHLDGSKLSFEENVKQTTALVNYAHDKGIPVEGEIDHIEGSSADHTKEDSGAYQKSDLYTNPNRALDFVSKTKVDVFASFIGNLHGIYKSEVRLNLDLFEEITKVLPNSFFSLHGGSGINNEDVKQVIQNGIVKVNVNSEMRVAYKMTLQNSLNSTGEIAPYKFAEQAVKAVQKVVERKIILFSTPRA